MGVEEKTQAARQGKEIRATCSPPASGPTQHASLCFGAQSLWEVELQLRKCASAANQGPMKAVKRIGRLRLDKLPQSPREAVPKCPAMMLLSLATALF